MIFVQTLIPHVLPTGIFVPILKKNTLNPNEANNYRPITLSSTHGKIIELLILPPDGAHENQFGFRTGRGTAMACSFLNDLMQYCRFNGSPMFICSLDAERCFDTIWHDGLFYKLIYILPQSHWLYLYRLYNRMQCIVRWEGSHSQSFGIFRGTKQGKILSPTLFNIFIDDLLKQLSSSGCGIRIDNDLFNSFAYADDVNLWSLSSVDLQTLIDICFQYSVTWRFTFGIKKTKCMIVGKNSFHDFPIWKLGDQHIDIEDQLEILGTTFSSSMSYHSHVEKRCQASRRAMCGIASIGCCYPGLSSEVKIHLWKTIGLPSLLYGMENLELRAKELRELEKLQSSIIKRTTGFPLRCHHTHLLNAVNVQKPNFYIQNSLLSLWNRMFLVNSPARRLSEKLLSTYLSKKLVIPGTIIHRMKNTGVSLVKGLFSRIYIPVPQVGNDNVNDGVVDSLRYLISHENFIKPYSNEHILGVLLTKAFWYACFPSCCCPAIWDYINYVHWCLYYLLLFYVFIRLIILSV